MRTIKNFAMVFMAIAFTTTSCVDNTVSPQVEAIRGQQVEWMKAKVASANALAAMDSIKNAYQILLNANQLLVNTNLDRTNQLTYDKAKADNATALKQAEVNLQIQKFY